MQGLGQSDIAAAANHKGSKNESLTDNTQDISDSMRKRPCIHGVEIKGAQAEMVARENEGAKKAEMATRENGGKAGKTAKKVRK